MPPRLGTSIARSCILTKWPRYTATESNFIVPSRLHSNSMASTIAVKRASHRFKPLLSDVQPHSEGSLQLRGIVFDMDGTLCKPQNYMFGQMRAAVSIPPSSDILDHIHGLPEVEQEAAMAKIRAIEREAMGNQEAQPGLVTLMEFLDEHKVLKAICTRNFDAPVNHLLTTHVPAHIQQFSPVVTREFRPPKPSPAGILHIAKAWNILDSASIPATPALERPLPIIMVGDSIDDMLAGRNAGAMTVLLRSEGKEELERHESTDVVIERLDDLIPLLEKGLEAQV
ncbi:putative hydrolase [Acrodontium crateriforme]|uniref:Hydrolase n=1 Tax=Acrodontium crateriforme TaxID=150365 RepID=A0AAQ3M570_9PEZI|nr:putative hydrolase [Acrodontium crateriforme]